MVLLCCLMFTGKVLADECGWPQWQSFKRDYVSRDGRVIDPADSKNVTTSEGQSYAMFFALVANDRDAFGKLFYGQKIIWLKAIWLLIFPAGCGASARTASGAFWTAIRLPMRICGLPTRCLKQVGYGILASIK